MSKMKNIFLILAALSLLFIMSCNKDKSPINSAPTKMIIHGITLDSAFQISNPMSFKVVIQNPYNSITTPFYDIPTSNTAWYPCGAWLGYNEVFESNTPIKINVYFSIGGGSQVYALPYGEINFTPKDKVGSSVKNSPINITLKQLMPPEPGSVSTQITLSVTWE